MNKGVIICMLFISVVAVASAQSWLESMMMFNLLSGRNSGGSEPAGGYQGGRGGYQASSAAYPTGQQRGSGGQRRHQNQGYRSMSTRTGMFGGSTPFGGGIGRLYALSQGGDTARNLLMCNMLPADMKTYCLFGGGLN